MRDSGQEPSPCRRSSARWRRSNSSASRLLTLARTARTRSFSSAVFRRSSGVGVWSASLKKLSYRERRDCRRNSSIALRTATRCSHASGFSMSLELIRQNLRNTSIARSSALAASRITLAITREIRGYCWRNRPSNSRGTPLAADRSIARVSNPAASVLKSLPRYLQ